MKNIWVVLAIGALVLAGCRAAGAIATTATQPSPSPQVAIPTESTTPPVIEEDTPAPAVADDDTADADTPEDRTGTTGAPTVTTTTVAPAADPALDEEDITVNTDEIDDLLADLDRIFGDLDSAMNQDEGDVQP